MRTIARYQPGLVSADSSRSVKQIEPGKMWLTMVTVEVIEIDSGVDDHTKFTLLPALPGLEKDPVKANLLRLACQRIAKTIEANPEHLQPRQAP